MKNKRLKILFLPAWYPTEENPVSGIFIKEHAKAVSLYNDVVVLFAYLDPFPQPRRLCRFYRISEDIEDGIRTIRVRYGAILAYAKDRLFKTFPKLDKNQGNTDKSILESNAVINVLKNLLRIPYLIVRGLLHYWSIFVAFRGLVKEGWRPDIIHAHVYSAGVPAAVISKLYKIPLIITEHFTNFATHSVTPFEVKKAKFAFKKAKIILPVSNDLKEAIRDFYNVKNRFSVVPNVVNTDTFYPLSIKKDEKEMQDKKKMLLVAILAPRKGISYLLEALASLKSKRDDFLLDIVGDGPSKKEYENLATKLGLGEIVKFWGRKPEVASFMRKCDFFVLPSLYENFGVVYIEAMACGKPVIATNAGGPKEFINKEVGILVSPKDSGALTKAIDYMLDHYQDYSSEKISQYVKENFSYEVVGKKLDEIYRDISEKNYKMYSVGNSGYKIRIKDYWKVLDVGSGHNPHTRANIILDKYIKDNKERSGQSIKIRYGQQFVEGDACSTPFKDKEFDYIIASHIAEHVNEPAKFCEELMRIGKRGYIETPSKFAEMILGEIFHKWYVYKKNGALIFEKKNKVHPLGLLGKVFYAIYYISIKREGKPTINFRNKYIKTFSNKFANYFLRKTWRILRKITYTCFEWQEKFDYKIIKK